MNRRDILRRLPVIPFVAGAVGAQLVNISKFGSQLPTSYSPVLISELPLEQRIVQFSQEIEWIIKPTLPLPEEFESMTPTMMRSVVQWQTYADNVSKLASYTSYQDIPKNVIEKIAGISLQTLSKIR